ncbi:alpha/beta-hydrolase [Aspergillus heteromorphus CBS 117.55]|uniref:Alpha/beta-hydrolase n=1 Tax=Aspergillus heteromorphus CBS 117.55 TaxID=1448321 RepID=A0A317WZJ6_9EURO|nr:alpha/beta-hydrolase [Aspergillus heteromorphus CBS 117.55]PWY90687.1 alpha/beta-hydrolase [Aspergillus heteromorphus CBS 117.55]
MASPFTVTEHVVDCQHIREYSRATRTAEDPLKLVVKRYTPKSNPNPQPGDVTIIGATGGGFPKEVYEPLWEEVYGKLNRQGRRIRSIWIADSVNQAASGILNEEHLGNEPSWLDHSRDLLYMINQFKADMPRPIMGVGHSLGAGQVALLSLIHPRLFTSLVLIEPVIAKDVIDGKGPIFAKLSLARKDVWPSRSHSAAYFKKGYKKWDARVLDLWLKHGLRDLEDISTPDPESRPVTLATTKHQEVAQYLRSNFPNRRPLDIDNDPDTQFSHDPSLYPDIIGPSSGIYPFYRLEPILLWKMIKHLRPSVLYLFGDQSPVSTPTMRAEKLHRTGKGIGGSGGYKTGRVKEVTIPNTGHHLPFEDVSGVSEATAEWLCQETKRWGEDEKRILGGWLEMSTKERSSIPQEWHGHLESFSVPSRRSKL